MNTISDIIAYLKGRTANVTCIGKDGLIELMHSLGFEHTEGKAFGHKNFKHTYLSTQTKNVDDAVHFIGVSIDCGHGNGAKIKKPYVNKIIKMLEMYTDYLDDFLQLQGK